MRTVERTSVAAVTGSPAFTKSFIDTVTPSRDATCTTMTLHAAPRIVALSASVELAASPSQSCVEPRGTTVASRSEEHTSELQSLAYLVCRLLLEKKKKNKN